MDCHYLFEILFPILCEKVIHRMKIQALSTICRSCILLYIDVEISYLYDYMCNTGWIFSIQSSLPFGFSIAFLTLGFLIHLDYIL